LVSGRDDETVTVMVTHSRLSVLWLCGAPAAGKSTVAWQTVACLSDRGLRVGYVDIDQVGMLYPRAAADPCGHAFKVDNFGGLVGTTALRALRCSSSQG